jgi:acetyl esterase/lipase
MQRIDVADVDVRKIRRLWDYLGGLMITASGVKKTRDEINGLYAEWLTPRNRMNDKLLLYLHGGGYVVGGCDMHRQMVSHIARAGHIQSLLPEYRLSPESKYPAAIEDVVGVYRTLLASGVKAENMVVAGDSAGGGLVVAMLLSLRDAGDPLPAAAILLSPFLDATASGESMQSRASQDPWFHPEDVSLIADYYCELQQRNDPLVSPIFADVGGLPPMYIQVGDDEILLSDSERFAEKIAAAGGKIDLEIWPEMWHVFQMFVGKMPESGRAIKKIGDFVRDCFA